MVAFGFCLQSKFRFKPLRVVGVQSMFGYKAFGVGREVQRLSAANPKCSWGRGISAGGQYRTPADNTVKSPMPAPGLQRKIEHTAGFVPRTLKDLDLPTR